MHKQQREGGDEAAEDFRFGETSPSARFGLAAIWETGLILSPSAARTHIAICVGIWWIYSFS